MGEKIKKRKKIHYDDSTTEAGNPLPLSLDHEKLKILRPDLYGFVGAMKRFWWWSNKMMRWRVYVEEVISFGDTRAAVVVSTSPLLVAAYTDELDCIVMLKFDDQLTDLYGLFLGSRLLTINTYKTHDTVDEDLIAGENSYDAWSGFTPIIAEFVSGDIGLIEKRKSRISDIEWTHTEQLGNHYLEVRPGVFRDGRPGYSWKTANMRIIGAY